MCTYITIYFLWVSLMTEKVGLIGCGVKWRSVQTRQGFAVLTFRHLHLDSPTYLSSAVLREKFLGWAWLGLFQVSAFYSVGTVWELVVRFSFSTSAALWEQSPRMKTPPEHYHVASLWQTKAELLLLDSCQSSTAWAVWTFFTKRWTANAILSPEPREHIPDLKISQNKYKMRGFWSQAG